jgi:hypothetical protein
MATMSENLLFTLRLELGHVGNWFAEGGVE